MFGYVMPHKCELRVRELSLYEAWYCGLCKTIRRSYGQIPRMALDYDCTFLALLLNGIAPQGGECRNERCLYKPLKPKRPVAQQSPALEYAADVNVLLYYHKLLDDWQDEKKLIGLAGHTLLWQAAQKASQKCARLNAVIETQLDQLSKLEAAGETSIDVVADAFAVLLKHVFSEYSLVSEKYRLPIGWLGYHLGRWIYLADAWEDREKDEKSGVYNPFLAANASRERASFLLYASLSEIEKAYDLLDIQYGRGLLDNIITMGCRNRTRILLGEEKDESI